MYKKVNLIIYLVLLSLFSACSSEDNLKDDIVIYGPKTLEITAKHEEFTLQFSKIAAIGMDNNKILPFFEIFINEKNDINTAKYLGKIHQKDDGSGLMRLFIKPTKTQEDGTNEVFIYPLKDETEYFVWIKACFEGYGCSGYTSSHAVPVPLPSKLTLNDVEVITGDTTLLVKIKNKNKYDEYGLLASDECKSPKLQKFDPKYNTNRDNIVISNFENNKSYPLCIRAQNINTNTANMETINWLQLGDFTPKPSNTKPATPVIQSTTEGHKRITVKWNGDYEGDDAVSKYEVIYSSNNNSKTENVVTDSYNIEHTILQLINGNTYNIQVRASNSAGKSESEIIKATPKESIVDYNNPETVIGKTAGRFIYAEDIPHSDFWRIDKAHPQGGRSSSDRLTRGKETALGNLWTDALMYYVKDKLNKNNVDFAVLPAKIINNGIDADVSITPKLLMALTEINHIDDTIVIAYIKGKYLINQNDYNINLDNYPPLGENNVAVSLFGQAASIYHNGHYGTGAGSVAYGTAAWLMPSKEVKYTIEYLPYSLEEFENNFKAKCGRVEDNKDYDSINDPKGCYLLKYDDVVGYSSPKEGYRRGRIKTGSLSINNQEIDPEKTYIVATTKKSADTIYTAFLYAEKIEDTNILLWKAVAEYINENGKIAPYLDGRVTLVGGIPGNSANNFHK